MNDGFDLSAWSRPLIDRFNMAYLERLARHIWPILPPWFKDATSIYGAYAVIAAVVAMELILVYMALEILLSSTARARFTMTSQVMIVVCVLACSYATWVIFSA